MSIKVTLGEAKPQGEKPFPKLMISKYGTIVLFHRDGYGFVVHVGDGSNNKITNLPAGWLMSDFTDYNEPITLQND